MSLILSGTDGLSDVDGTAATPAIRGTDANTGIFFGTDIIGFSEGGVEAARINADSQFVAAAGTAALPVITTTGDLNTGIFFPAADTIAFAEGGVEAARIDSAGNLGLGATPSAWLSSTVAMQIGNYGNLFAFKNSGNVYLNNNSFTNTSGTDIYLNTAPAGRYRISDNTHIWYNAASGTAGNPITFTQAMTLDASGNLGIGTSSPSSRLSVAGNITLTTASPTISTALNDDLAIKNTNNGGSVSLFSGNSLAIECNSVQNVKMPFLAGVGTRSVNVNSIGTLAGSSDSRLKQEVQGQTLPSLAEVMQLEVKAYKWLDDINLRGADAAVEIGFFADQVAPIIPSAAPMGRDGYYGFYDRSVIAALVNAIKEQQALITALTARITALETP